MKKFVVSILAVLYLSTSSGATIYLHYCMGEIASSSFWENHGKNCSNCGMEKEESQNNSCCKDDSQWIKIDDDQQASVLHFDISKFQSELIRVDFFDRNYYASQENLTCINCKAPQRSCELPLHVLNCTFRI
jgi:hypothetical protein